MIPLNLILVSLTAIWLIFAPRAFAGRLGAVAPRLVMYPGLNQVEKELTICHPWAALVVFTQKEVAERTSRRHYPDQTENDEGDALRHFVWAGLLTRRLGTKLANQFLDAHEARPSQSAEEERMDRHNNWRGGRATRQLRREGRWSRRTLERAGLDELREGRLVVIRPGRRLEPN